MRLPADFHGEISSNLHQRNQSTSGAKNFALHTGSSTQNLAAFGVFLRLRQGQSGKLPIDQTPRRQRQR